MNRWQALQLAARQPKLAGEFIDDWTTVPRRIIPPAAAPSPVLRPVVGRNMKADEALAADLAARLRPPAVTARKAASGASLGAALTGAGQVETVRSPWVETPAGGQPFTFLNAASVTLPAQGATVTVVTFTVPRRKNGVIEFIANQFVGGGWTEGTGELVWRITADGVPIQGYDNIIGSIGSLSNPGWLGTRPIRVYENQIIALTLNNVGIAAPAGQALLGLFRGGFYSIEQEGQNTWL